MKERERKQNFGLKKTQDTRTTVFLFFILFLQITKEARSIVPNTSTALFTTGTAATVRT